MSVERAWDRLREAYEDLESCQLLLNGGQYHHVCFHAQQAAEKALKAALISLRFFEREHSVVHLLRRLSQFVNVPTKLMNYARILDQYYIPPRYPNAFDMGTPADYYTREQAEEALRIAREVVDFCEKNC